MWMSSRSMIKENEAVTEENIIKDTRENSSSRRSRRSSKSRSSNSRKSIAKLFKTRKVAM